MIHDIYTGTAGQKSVKDGAKCSYGYILYSLQTHALFLFLSTIIVAITCSTTTTTAMATNTDFCFLLVSHVPLNSAKTLLSLLRHCFLPRKSIAPQVHLPTRNTIHHSRGGGSVSTPLPILLNVRTQPFHKLCIRFRPLVQINVICSDRYSCVINAARDAPGSHVFQVSGRIRFLKWGVVDLYKKRKRRLRMEGRGIQRIC